jgi:hypothetical protein
MDTVYIGKCRYESQEQIPVWYAGIYRLISSTGTKYAWRVCVHLNAVKFVKKRSKNLKMKSDISPPP